MKLRVVKRYLSLIFFVLVCHRGYSQIPLITMQIDNQIKEDFHLSMSYLAENPGEDFLSFGGDISYFGPLGDYLANISVLWFMNINDMISVPVFGGGAYSYQTGKFEYSYGYSLSAGSGIIFKHPYFMMGVMGGLYIDGRSVQGYTYGNDNSPNVIRPTFGLFPVFDASKYPLLSYFMKKIEGFVYSNEPEIKDTRIETLNYLLNISFKRFLALSVLELYARNGINDVMIGYDLSNFTMEIENKSLNNTGNSFHITDSADARRYKTVSYGLRIGGGPLVADLNYLMIDGLGDYDYPFALNGFPSATINYSIEDPGRFSGWSGLFLRFSTLNLSGKPYIPDIGLTAEIKTVKAIVIYSFPNHFGFAIRRIM